jgi:hypothetical protein
MPITKINNKGLDAGSVDLASNVVTGLLPVASVSGALSSSGIKTVGGVSLVGSGDVPVQATLVSGTTIKTVGGQSLLGSGDLTVSSVSVGDIISTTNTLSAPSYLPCDGQDYLSASYPALIGKLSHPSVYSAAVGSTVPVTVNWGLGPIGYGAGTFVLKGRYSSGSTIDYLFTSTDGITWTQRTYPFTGVGSPQAFAYGNGVFVACFYTNNAGDGPSSVVCTSTDGITWTQRSLPASGYNNQLLYANGKFLITSDSGTLFTSTTGVTWTTSTMQSGSWTSFSYGNGKYILTGGALVLLSTDSITWNVVSVPFSSGSLTACFGNGFFLLSNGSTYCKSADGLNWLVTGTSPQTAQLMAYGGGFFLASDYANGRLYLTKDGNVFSSPGGASQSRTGCIFGGEKFVMAISLGTTYVIPVTYDTTKLTTPSLYQIGINSYIKAQ